MKTNNIDFCAAGFSFGLLRQNAPTKRGVALVAVIVLLSVSLTLFGLWSETAVRDRSRLTAQQYRLQAVQLAEAGLKRAIAQRASNSAYNEETWAVPASELDKIHAGQVRLRVAPTSDASAIRYEATAEYPAGAMRRVQITKSVEISNEAKKP